MTKLIDERKLLNLISGEGLSKAVIRRELLTTQIEYQISDEDLEVVIEYCYDNYISKEYATLVGLGHCAAAYIEELYGEGKTVKDWDVERFDDWFHDGSGNWY